jgi:hypothetical protein
MAHTSDRTANIAATTLEHIRKEVADGVYMRRPLLRFFREKGNFKKLDGGRFYYCPVIQAPALSAWYNAGTSFGGAFTQTGDDDQIIDAKYEWTYLYSHLSVDGAETFQNMGKLAIIDSIKTRVDLMTEELAHKLNEAVFDYYTAAGCSSLFNGLNVVAPDDGALCNSQKLGMLDAATVDPLTGYTSGQWTAQNLDAQADYSDLIAKMLSLWVDIYQEGGNVAIIPMHPDVYEAYETVGANNAKFMDRDLVDLGFQLATYKGKPIVIDDSCQDSTSAVGSEDECLYMLDTRHVGLFAHVKRDPQIEDLKRSEINVDSWIARCYWMGGMWCNNRRRQGVISFSE